MTDKLYPAFTFIGFVLVLIPLPWHLQAWNAGTCLFMVWTAIGCLIHFVNSLVWSGNLELHSAPWCDISSKLIVGLSVALPCASLCINRRLYSIATVSQVHTTKAEKRRIVYIDLAIGVGFPIIVMVLHYIVQGHRFDIFEDIGCWPSTFNTPPAYPLVWMWPIIIGLISMVFCVLSLRAFFRRRKEFNELLAANHNMNVNRYFRLMALATIEITTTTPFAIYFMYLNLTTLQISPWVSWSDTKWHFSRIDYIQAFFVDTQPMLKLNFSLNLWLFPGCAILFFAFFGLAEEARRNYKKFYYFLVKPFGITPPAYNPSAICARSNLLKDNITLPRSNTSSFHGTSEYISKWDELSLKMPDLTEMSSNPNLPYFMPPAHHVSFVLPTTSTCAMPVSAPSTTTPLSLPESQRSMSMDGSLKSPDSAYWRSIDVAQPSHDAITTVNDSERSLEHEGEISPEEQAVPTQTVLSSLALNSPQIHPTFVGHPV